MTEIEKMSFRWCISALKRDIIYRVLNPDARNVASNMLTHIQRDILDIAGDLPVTSIELEYIKARIRDILENADWSCIGNVPTSPYV